MAFLLLRTYLVNCCSQFRRLEFGPVCEFCLANPKKRRDDENLLEADPALDIQVETLLRLITLTTLHMVRLRWSSPHRLKRSSRCLANLNKTLLREQRHLRSLETWPVSKIEVVSDFSKDTCDRCGHRFVNILLPYFQGTQCAWAVFATVAEL